MQTAEQGPPRKLGQIFFISYLFTKPHRLVGHSAQNMHIAYVCTYPLICGQDGYVVAQWGLSPFEVSKERCNFSSKYRSN